MPRILVVHYSRTGHTRQVAMLVAKALGADLEEIVDLTKRTGIWGYLKSGREAFLRRPVPIGPSVHDPAGYDLVVMGTPIWNASLSAPVRSYIARHRATIRAAAFFCTCGGMGIDRVFAQMADACGRQPLARLAVREADLTSSGLPAKVDRFAAEIKAAMSPAARPIARPA